MMNPAIGARLSSRPGFRLSVQKLLQILSVLDQIRTERHALARLDDRALQDIGIDRATAVNESARGYFDVPADRMDN